MTRTIINYLSVFLAQKIKGKLLEIVDNRTSHVDMKSDVWSSFPTMELREKRHNFYDVIVFLIYITLNLKESPAPLGGPMSKGACRMKLGDLYLLFRVHAQVREEKKKKLTKLSFDTQKQYHIWCCTLCDVFTYRIVELNKDINIKSLSIISLSLKWIRETFKEGKSTRTNQLTINN